MINTKDEFKVGYWNYYLSIEREFMDITKYIPIDEQNDNTFSISYMKLYFTICSEIDVVCKEFIEYFTENSINKSGIDKYKCFITDKYPKFSSEQLLYPDNRLIQPFKDWSKSKLEWWDIYNALKHKRTSLKDKKQNYKMATQKNVIHSLSGLYQLEMYFYKEIIDKTDPSKNEWLRIPVPQSEIFRIKDWPDWPDNVFLIDNRFTFYINKQGELICAGDFK